MGTNYLAEAKDGVLEWLESVRYTEDGWGRWKYNAKQERPWSLQASGIAIRILDQYDELRNISDADKQNAIDLFLGCQDKDDGLFKDPLEDESNHVGSHTWEQVWGQRHGTTVQVLNALGGEPKYPIPTVQFVDLTKVDGTTFTMERIDWRNPWGHGESWSRAIRAYLRSFPEDQRNDQHPVLRDAFEAFEANILDPVTGYPSRGMEKDEAPRAMAGLFKTLAAYLVTGREFPYAKQGIDSTLKLQHEDGEFEPGSNMCLQWDPMWVLRVLDYQLNGTYRHDELVESGIRLNDRLMAHYRKPDGAFSFNGALCQTNHHSIRLTDKGYPIGDMLGTTMVLKCLLYVDEWTGTLPATGPEPLI